jgi:hypothetical protein
MIGRVVATGIPFSWVAGDEVYGGNPQLRTWLEDATRRVNPSARIGTIYAQTYTN